jgi:hypothetical protein
MDMLVLGPTTLDAASTRAAARAAPGAAETEIVPPGEGGEGLREIRPHEFRSGRGERSASFKDRGDEAIPLESGEPDYEPAEREPMTEPRRSEPHLPVFLSIDASVGGRASARSGRSPRAAFSPDPWSPFRFRDALEGVLVRRHEERGDALRPPPRGGIR